MKPLISVIIPAHNNAETIGQAIESMVHQTWENLEIVIVDDNSTDATARVARDWANRDPRVSYYRLPFNDPFRVNKRGRNVNAGYMARNYGFEKVTGDLITFQDADDVSFLNRIEVQYELLTKLDAHHITLDWQQFNKDWVGKKFDAAKFMRENANLIMKPQEIVRIGNRAKGFIPKYFPRISSKVNFEIKRLRIVNKLFFGSLDSYPGTGNSPLFRKEVVTRVKFRSISDRIWPSFTGRGADRDFNFQVAETFKKSYTVFLPLYMWRVNKQNEKYEHLESYIIYT